MAFFDKLSSIAKNVGEKANEVAKNVGEKASSAVEIGKLNGKISTEKSAAAAELKKIGEVIYARFLETGEADEAIKAFLENAKSHFEAAASAQAAVEALKAAKEEAGEAAAEAAEAVQEAAAEAAPAEEKAE